MRNSIWWTGGWLFFISVTAPPEGLTWPMRWRSQS